jgi:hypothetical protein
MNRIYTVLILLLFVTPLLATNVSAANQQGEVTYEDFDVTYHNLPTNPVTMDQENFEYKHQICGYTELGVRGECDTDVYNAPGELWFNYEIPLANDGTWPGFGDYVRFYVDNNGDPHYVHINVWICWELTDNRGVVMCVFEDRIYEDEYERANMQTMRSNNWFIHITAEEGTGGDETEISVEYRIDESSGDRLEPQLISHTSIPITIEAKTCADDCSSASRPDPLDIFKIDDVFAGQEIEIEFSSREYELGNEDYDLRMYYREDYDLSGGLNYSFYEIDDTGDWDLDIHRTTYTHKMDKSGALYVWFQAGFDSDVTESQSYTVKFASISGSIITTADLDEDGLPDYEEYLCGSDYRDPLSTAPDWDNDDVCNSNDDDDDNDGFTDENDPCVFSPMDESDYDNDGCTDSEDPDDDNDGVTDFNDFCQFSTENEDVDTDGDGCFNKEDDDDDGDGWFDLEEIDCYTDPLSALSIPSDFDLAYEMYIYANTGEYTYSCDEIDYDDDEDGVLDILDDCQFSDWYYVDLNELSLTITDIDTDGDGCFNEEDDDDDQDGLNDENDACPTGLSSGFDLDQDGCYDEEDDDVDGDGFSNNDEIICNSDERDANDTPQDMDSDSQCDNIDDDIDGDGVGNANDDFPTDASETKDTDNDGIGNNDDDDDDNDGYDDLIDDLPLNPNEQLDTDNDGVGNNADDDDDGDTWLDSQEQDCQTDSLNSNSVPIDTDGDRICNLNDLDDDGDNYNDDVEIACDTDPLQFTDNFPDFDDDGTCDKQDNDDDNDNIKDTEDACDRSPQSEVSANAADFDNDGCFDSEDPDIDGDGVMNNADECDKEVADTSDGCKEQTWFQANSGLVFGGGAVAVILILAGLFVMTKMVGIGATAAKDVGSLGVSQYNDNSRTTVTQMMNSGNRTSLTDSLNQHSIKMDNSAISDVGNTRGGDNVNATNSNVNTGSGDQSGSTNK